MNQNTNVTVKSAVITKAMLTTEYRGVLTAWVMLDYGGAGQGFGGHALYVPSGFMRHELKSFAGHFLWRVMEVVGVSEWGSLPGKSVRVRAGISGVEAIGHIVRDDWFCPAKDFGGGST